jgi:hypothetical protein
MFSDRADVDELGGTSEMISGVREHLYPQRGRGRLLLCAVDAGEEDEALFLLR